MDLVIQVMEFLLEEPALTALVETLVEYGLDIWVTQVEFRVWVVVILFVDQVPIPTMVDNLEQTQTRVYTLILVLMEVIGIIQVDGTLVVMSFVELVAVQLPQALIPTFLVGQDQEFRVIPVMREELAGQADVIQVVLDIQAVLVWPIQEFQVVRTILTPQELFLPAQHHHTQDLNFLEHPAFPDRVG